MNKGTEDKMSATGVLAYLICILEMNLTELASAGQKSEYIEGSWEACIECLEIIGRWTKAKDYGLTYDPEIKYKLFNRDTARCFCAPPKTPRRSG